jgi:hypothetical protein
MNISGGYFAWDKADGTLLTITICNRLAKPFPNSARQEKFGPLHVMRSKVHSRHATCKQISQQHSAVFRKANQ